MLAAMWCNGSVFGIQNAFGILFLSLLREFGSEDDEDLRFRTALDPFAPDPKPEKGGHPWHIVYSEAIQYVVYIVSSIECVFPMVTTANGSTGVKPPTRLDRILSKQQQHVDRVAV
ncbi:hypothetical protein NHX12_026626 [Muraenolepis orangiensis]|uniref:Uncharacterized protein n=1 Tax=Muraenolepis orangiensis TaxID=630683 RepID=A0A9Q0EMQ4_9TELE|nr:hypothetical protein NHX12_026626 [Muraenolepis orangiensis]